MATHKHREDLVPTYEFELRYVERNHDRVVESLRGLGAKFKVRLFQNDYYFSPPPLRTIEKGAILRIREETREDSTKRVMLSFKSPNVLKDGVETREEIEVEVQDSVQQTAKLMQRLGARTLVTVTKERSEYTLELESVDFTVTLDQVVALGSFVEIELVSAKKEDVNRLVTLGEKLAANLGLDPLRKITLGYHELLMEKKM